MTAHLDKTYIKPLTDESHSSDGKHLNVTSAREEKAKKHNKCTCRCEAHQRAPTQSSAEAFTAHLVLLQTTLWNETAVTAAWKPALRLDINHIPSHFAFSITSQWGRLAFVCSANTPTYFLLPFSLPPFPQRCERNSRTWNCSGFFFKSNKCSSDSNTISTWRLLDWAGLMCARLLYTSLTFLMLISMNK